MTVRPFLLTATLPRTTIRALGCTDRRQAHRLGRDILSSNQLNTETVSFSVGTEGAMLLPGDICLIADPEDAYHWRWKDCRRGATNVVVDRNITGVNTVLSWYPYIYGNSGIGEIACKILLQTHLLFLDSTIRPQLARCGSSSMKTTKMSSAAIGPISKRE